MGMALRGILLFVSTIPVPAFKEVFCVGEVQYCADIDKINNSMNLLRMVSY